MSVLGIDIGGTFIKFCGKAGKSIKKGKVQTEKSVDSILYEIKRIVKNFHPKALGIGIAGLYDKKSEKLTNSPNIPFVEGLPLKEILQKEFNIPVIVENDASAAAFGEYSYGAGKNSKILVCLTLGTGLGGGLVIEGNLISGVSGSAMEIGHTTVNFDGWHCHCGRRGCLEAYVSSYGLERIYFMLTDQKLSSTEIITLANEGKTEAMKAIDEFSEYLSTGLMNILHTFNPDTVVIGGGIPQHYPAVIDLAVSRLKEKAFSLPFRDCQIKKAELGEFSGAFGAMALSERLYR
ncbi:ROK family protein [Persephonella atlantica]|uniref:ROK family protein n=1 Tax=Persephonella atlantica TaxID=2699429 RepID=A0ABS1GG36_9AQUI|nr:ROK family protein [Persephonella atlantica]MBK3331889.1 ROK family protein [Persephonella atlantica]